MLTFHMIML